MTVGVSDVDFPIVRLSVVSLYSRYVNIHQNDDFLYLSTCKHRLNIAGSKQIPHYRPHIIKKMYAQTGGLHTK